MTLVPEPAAFRRFHLHRAQLAVLLAAALCAGRAAAPAGPGCACAGRYAIAHPVFLGAILRSQLVALDLFLFQHLVAPVLEGGEALLQPARLAAVQPHRGAREIFQKAPVMADQHQRALRTL